MEKQENTITEGDIVEVMNYDFKGCFGTVKEVFQDTIFILNIKGFPVSACTMVTNLRKVKNNESIDLENAKLLDYLNELASSMKQIPTNVFNQDKRTFDTIHGYNIDTNNEFIKKLKDVSVEFSSISRKSFDDIVK